MILIDENNIFEVLEELDLLEPGVFVACVPDTQSVNDLELFEPEQPSATHSNANRENLTVAHAEARDGKLWRALRNVWTRKPAPALFLP